MLHRTPCSIFRRKLACGAAVLATLLAGATQASELRRDAVVRAIENVQPSVVNIHGEKTVLAEPAHEGVAEAGRRVNGMGTGVIIDERGYILTNYHVVDGVLKIQVTLATGKLYVAKLVANDAVTDLAIIRIETEEDLPVIRTGTSSDLMLGEPVLALGNAYGYENTVTRGIISALHRTVQVTDAQSYEDLIQTDASINPGNSGGPLVNIDGEMIGINVAVRAGALGIGFAIPVDRAMAVAHELMSSSRSNSAWHGLEARTAEEDAAAGYVVDKVIEDSPADESGLKPGDQIVSANDRTIERPLDFERALLGHKAGDEIALKLRRGDEELELPLVLARAPEDRRRVQDRNWEILGMRLEPVSGKEFQEYRTRYRGGLLVKDVRADSPAMKQGIRRGDVLVGMHVWETVSLENVAYILARPDFAADGPVKFYIIRGSETLFGHLTLSMRSDR